jgi:UDP-apiose/xylose synthase
MRLVILGAGGFIGSNLIEHLVAEGSHEVVGVDISNEKLAGIDGPGFKFIQANISESPDLIDDLIMNGDVIVDLVAYANPSIYVVSPLEVVNLNFFENLRIAEMCVAHGKRLIQYSTAEVYGKTGHGDQFSEDTSDLILGPVTRQRWIYAAAKQLLERVIHAYGTRGDLDYTIVRPFNFIGPRFDYLVPAGTTGGPRVFAHFMSALLTGGPMYLVDGGEQHRCFTHYQDANQAFSVILEHPGAHNEILNIGNPDTDTSIRNVAVLMKEIYAELTGETPHNELTEISGEEFYGPGYEDANRIPPDVTKLRALGWSPQHGLDDALRDTIEFNLDPKNHTSIVGGTK